MSVLYDISSAFKDRELDFKKTIFDATATGLNPCRWEVSSYDDKERYNLKDDGQDYYIFDTSVDDEDELYGDEQIIRFEDTESAAECIQYSEFETENRLDALLDMIEWIICAYRNGEEKELRSGIDMAEDFIVNHFGEEE